MNDPPSDPSEPDEDVSLEDSSVVDEPLEDNHAASPNPSPSDMIGLADARETALEAAADLLEHELEGVIKVERADDAGWRVVVEVLERNAVPDTQDILGRYEISLNSTGKLDGYGLLERYRRGDMKEEL